MDSNLALSGAQSHPESHDGTMRRKVKRRIRQELAITEMDQKAVAIGTSTDPGQFSRMLNDACDDSFPAHRIPALTRELGPGFMEWLALQCGGVYHHAEACHTLHASPLTLVGLLANYAGKSVQQLLQDFKDGVWTREERQADLPTLRKLRQVIDTLIADAEGVKPL